MSLYLHFFKKRTFSINFEKYSPLMVVGWREKLTMEKEILYLRSMP